MSKNIYFSKSKTAFLIKKAVAVATRWHHKIAPDHAVTVARKLLMTPNRKEEFNPKPNEVTKAAIDTREGKIMTYEIGEGPRWILIHGWSGGASQFFPLMEYIASIGYSALAYDQPAHGLSAGREGNLINFIHALEDILDKEGEIEGVIAHSMGAATLLECQHERLHNKPYILIAPVLDYWENLFSIVKASGYSMDLFQALIQDVEKQAGVNMEEIDPFFQLFQRDVRTTILHDKDDRIVPFKVSVQAAEFSHVRLIGTEGMGHSRVLLSELIKKVFRSVAKYTSLDDKEFYL